MTARAFITATDHPTRADRALIRGGPAEPLREAADLAGVALRWDRARRGWTCPADRLADVIAAGQYANLVTVRSAS